VRPIHARRAPVRALVCAGLARLGPPERSPVGRDRGRPGSGPSSTRRGGPCSQGWLPMRAWRPVASRQNGPPEAVLIGQVSSNPAGNVPAARAVRGRHRQEPGPEPCARGLGAPEGDAPGGGVLRLAAGDAPDGGVRRLAALAAQEMASLFSLAIPYVTGIGLKSGVPAARELQRDYRWTE